MEQKAITNVVVLATVLDEVRHRNRAMYARLRALVDRPEKRFVVYVNEHSAAT